MADTPKLNLGLPDPVEIIDPDNCPVLFGEVVTELRVVEGAVYLSLGNVIMDGDAPVVRKVKVSARLRISVGAANTIMRCLSEPAENTAPEGTKLN